MKNIKIFLLKIFIFYNLKNLCILHGQVFVMSKDRVYSYDDIFIANMMKIIFSLKI